MSKATKTRPDPLAFPAALTMDEFRKAKEQAQDYTITRNIVFASLTQSGHEMAQAAWTQGNTFLEVMGYAMDYQAHLEGRLEIVKSAVARMIAVGQELSEHGRPSYVTGDPEPVASA